MSAPPTPPLTPAEFVARHGEALVHNLGHDCFRAAEEICASLGAAGQLPDGVTLAGTLQVILSMRATLELMAVEQRFGETAHDALLATMEDYYGRTLLERGSFRSWIRAAHETMRRSDDARAWLRIHAMQLLGTRDPAAAMYHVALGYGLRAGVSIAEAIATNTDPASPGEG